MNSTFNRRAFIQAAVAGLATSALCGLTAGWGAGFPARPPGALEESAFMARCARCMRCVDVCAPLALRPGGWVDGARHLGTPILDAGRCTLCMECVRYCPTGALIKISKTDAAIGLVPAGAGAGRLKPSPGHLLARRADGTEPPDQPDPSSPLEAPPPSYAEWFAKRLYELARHHGLRE